MKGLARNTEKVFNYIKDLDLLKEYMLIGGTALGMQINHRLSEDLDFCKWQDDPKIINKEINWPQIENALRQYGEVKTDILDLYQVNFYLNETKISFYSNKITASSEIRTEKKYNKIRLASIKSLGCMKLEVMSRRYLYRDYYDVYSILMEGISLKDLVSSCGKYSRHRMKSKMILGTLSDGVLFRKEENFELFEPKYNIGSKDIESFMRVRILQEFS